MKLTCAACCAVEAQEEHVALKIILFNEFITVIKLFLQSKIYHNKSKWIYV